MSMPDTKRRYSPMRAWMGRAEGKGGLDRIASLGVSWGSRDRPDAIVAALGQAEDAPALPPVHTFRDRMAFLAGVCWCMTWLTRKGSR